MDASKELLAGFFCNAASEPVREWLHALSPADRKLIVSDLKTIQFGWPLGMPAYRLLSGGLYEVRSSLPNRRACVLFFISDGQLILLHGFITEDERTPEEELRLARDRMGTVLNQVSPTLAAELSYRGRGTRTNAEDGP